MQNAHPGHKLSELIDHQQISVYALAAQMKVSPGTLYRVLNGEISVTADMAVRLERHVKGIKAEEWMRLQAAFDLAEARQKPLDQPIQGRRRRFA